MSTELVERLRAGVPLTEVDGREVADTDAADATMEAAADELTALTAKVALLTEALEKHELLLMVGSIRRDAQSVAPVWLRHADEASERARALSEPEGML